MSESRQLAAIVFSDISGFTHTMETDENRAMEQVQKHREIVGNKLIEQYHEHSKKNLHPRFFWCRVIIKAYESNLN